MRKRSTKRRPVTRLGKSKRWADSIMLGQNLERMRMRQRTILHVQLMLWTVAWLSFYAFAARTWGQVSLSNLTDLQMAPYDADFQHITIPSTGQLLSRIGPSVWQG